MLLIPKIQMAVGARRIAKDVQEAHDLGFVAGQTYVYMQMLEGQQMFSNMLNELLSGDDENV